MSTNSEPVSRLLDELAALLAEERQALLAGRPEPIARIARQKLRLAATIEEAYRLDGPLLDREALRRLERTNRENSVICAAMLRHLTAALDTLRRHDPHRSYTPDGTEQNPPAPQALGAA